MFEVEELRSSVEYDMESMEDAIGFVTPLERMLRDLQTSLRNGSYEFGTTDLPFMAIVRARSQLMLPFKTLLRQINETHREGLQEADDT